MTGQYFINATDIWTTWGMFPPKGKGFYSSLLRAPERSFGVVKNWADKNGTQRALSTITYNDRELDLTFILSGASKSELLERYNDFRSFVLGNNAFTLKCMELDRLFTLKYAGMPSFNKLTVFDRVVQGVDSICAELTLSLRDEDPTTYLDASGAAIPLTFPSPTPDVPIDLNDYTFALVGKDVIMTGEDLASEDIRLDGNSLDDYGLIPKSGLYNELLRFPEAKGEVEEVYSSRELALPFYLVANSDVQFYQQYYSLLGFLLDSGYFHFDIGSLNKRFDLLYTAMPSLNQLTVIKGNDRIACELVINCVDDAPSADGGLGLFDGRFKVVDGNLIYTQSDYWDSKIGWDLVDNDLVKEIL